MTNNNADNKWMLPLCISHGAAAWGERSWEFGAGLLLLEHSNQNLRLTATLVFISYSSIVLFGSTIGVLVERGSLLKNAVASLGLQNLALVAASGSMCIRGSIVATWLSIGCSVIAELASMASSIVTEKQWTKALADSSFMYTQIVQEGEERGTSPVLTHINAQMRAIDLMCKLLAPMGVGFLLEYTSPTITCLGIAAFNLVAWPIEVACLLWISRNYTLHDEEQHEDNGDLRGSHGKQIAKEEKEREDNGRCYLETERQDSMQNNRYHAQLQRKQKSPLRIYFAQPILGSSLAFAFLGLTVISFGSLMTAWLVSLDFRESQVAMTRSLAALAGILATRFSLRGTTAIWLMWISLLPTALVAPFANQHRQLLWVIVGSVILSRFGLWAFDLYNTRLLQSVDHIGITNGVQDSLQSFFVCLMGLLCMLLPHPSQFIYLVEVSFGSITTAALMHTLWWKCRQ